MSSKIILNQIRNNAYRETFVSRTGAKQIGRLGLKNSLQRECF